MNKSAEFTLKDLFPDMNKDQRAKIGFEVLKTFKTFNAGRLPEKRLENHYSKEVLVWCYPVMISGFDFKDYIKSKYS